jgi:hypothetical protein
MVCTEGAAGGVGQHAVIFDRRGFPPGRGSNAGRLGHPLARGILRFRYREPGNAGNPVPLGQPGCLLVRGPQCDAGLLGRPGTKTAEVLRDGWYRKLVTWRRSTKMASSQITDRLSRFSKVAREMGPPHRSRGTIARTRGCQRTDRTFVVARRPGRGRRASGWVVVAQAGRSESGPSSPRNWGN